MFGAIGGFVTSFLVGVVVNRIQSGAIPRKYKHELVQKVLDLDRETVRAAYPSLDEEEWFDAVETSLDDVTERAVSIAPNHESVWAAGNVLQAAGELALEKEAQGQRNLYRRLAQRIADEWYLKDFREARDADLEARKTQISDFEYRPLESTSGEVEAHILSTATENLRREQGVTVREGAVLELVCSSRLPRGEINLLTGIDLGDNDEVEVEFAFDDQKVLHGRWMAERSLRASGYVRVTEPEPVRSIVERATGANQLTLYIYSLSGEDPSTYTFGLRGLTDALKRMPCFEDLAG